METENKQLIFVHSGAEEELTVIEELLPQIPGEVAVECIPILRGYFTLPWLETPEGTRYHGQKSIERFIAENYKE